MLEQLLLSLTLTLVASIENYSETYSCDLKDRIVVHVPSHFNFTKSCEEEWTKLPEKISIALVATPSEPQCHSPCVQVSHRELILNECSQVELIIICAHSIKTWEKRIVFHGNETRRTTKEETSRYHLCYIPLMVILAVILFLYLYFKDANP